MDMDEDSRLNQVTSVTCGSPIVIFEFLKFLLHFPIII